ncbi:unnamed protein product [Miscanthus lutarioriparius]|uniref:Uncharacterized protein n=1 Tax=Miscanthus lutarioriparius TaxID=422564 RepID=A0A811MHZ2_9POAL|nr:unnamed protein product [Miscanthus lutarioriparius]
MAVGDLAFKALTTGLGVATLYLAATFSVNVYRGLSWHSEQSNQISALISDPFAAYCEEFDHGLAN